MSPSGSDPPGGRHTAGPLPVTLLGAALFGLAYFAFAELGHLLTVEPSNNETIWPPSGLFLAVLLLTPPRRWGVLVLATLPATLASDVLVHHQSVLASLCFCAANSLEALVGAWLVRRFGGAPPRMDTLRGVLVLTVVSTFFGAPVGALAGAAVIHHTFGDPYWTSWLIWWTSDLMGYLIISPLVLLLAAEIDTARPRPSLARIAEALVLGGGLAVATYATYASPFRVPAFLAYPFLLWAALRFGQRGVVLTLPVLAAIAVTATAHGLGSMAVRGASLLTRMTIVQTYVAISSLMFLTLGAVLAGLRRAEAALREANATLEERIRKRTEEAAAQAEELRATLDARLVADRALREADRQKDEFLAILAHELRNPLAPIRNAVELLGLPGAAEPRLHNARKVIDRQVGHLVRLVDDLLDVSRITRGKITLQRERMDLRDVVAAALEASRPNIEASGHELELALPELPLHVSGDLTRLAQVLSNLLNNAAKYTPRGGRLRLEVERQGDAALLRVSDSGIGIPKEVLPRVFDMFMQVDQRVERAQGGLGIGLTLVKRLVELHDGSVNASSDGAGRGSTFTVRLPLEALPQEAPAEPAVAAPRPQGYRILVVDDNADAADTLVVLLEELGHEVRVAYDGPSALAVAPDFAPQIVLLDLGLPGMNGYDVARRLRTIPTCQRALLVAQTGWGQAKDRQRSREAGFDHHLVKPLDLPALERLLSQHPRS